MITTWVVPPLVLIVASRSPLRGMAEQPGAGVKIGVATRVGVPGPRVAWAVGVPVALADATAVLVVTGVPDATAVLVVTGVPDATALAEATAVPVAVLTT